MGQSVPSNEVLATSRECNPAWADPFARMARGPWQGDVLPRKLLELVSLAVNIATRRHISGALDAGAGASVKEIFEVLKTCISQGAHACNLGVPLLEQELALRQADGRTHPEGAVSP